MLPSLLMLRAMSMECLPPTQDIVRPFSTGQVSADVREHQQPCLNSVMGKFLAALCPPSALEPSLLSVRWQPLPVERSFGLSAGVSSMHLLADVDARQQGNMHNKRGLPCIVKPHTTWRLWSCILCATATAGKPIACQSVNFDMLFVTVYFLCLQECTSCASRSRR